MTSIGTDAGGQERGDDLDCLDRGGAAPTLRIASKGMPLRNVERSGWGVFDSDVTYPVAVIFESAIDHNSKTMMEFCARRGVSLAPHGKTTMSPALFRRQLRDGAWAMTAATTWQAKAMRDVGVERVIIANQVVVPAEIGWLADADADGFDVCCYVDSVGGVGILDEVFAGLRRGRRFPVLVELGIAGGRTGARDVAGALAVADAVARSQGLTLIGVAGFEGILGAVDDRGAAEVVIEFVDQIVELANAVNAAGWFDSTREVIVTAGGSAYFDHVVDRLSRIDLQRPTRIVVRAGCYLTHDDGAMHEVSPMGEHPRTDGGAQLLPALEVWGAVLSRPEPTRAIIGLGKRDVSTDGLLPVVKKLRRRGSTTIERIEPLPVVQVNDQHAYLDLDPSYPLAVGDLVGVGISHPCTTFDKWRAIAVVDDDYRVIEISETLF